MKKIGVEEGLKNVSDYLRSQGYSVQDLSPSIENNSSKLNGLDAIVTSDLNTNMLGFFDPETKIPVINASGMTAEDVKREIDEKSANLNK
ncbi:MAG: YkuS family protein [Bacillota bacterium]|nr:YkuS family protein [Bacillota bacterium]